MNSKLEIRAAKTLGCKEDAREDDWIIFINCPKEMLAMAGKLTHGVGVAELKFTSSYDWAMLGVKEVDKKSHMAHFCSELGVLRPEHSFRRSPKEITEAWVKTLENV